MKTTIENNIPDDLRLISAIELRKAWHLPVVTEWRMERNGELKPLRIGRRKYYRLSDLRQFLDLAAQKPPLAVPWRK